MVSNQKDYVCIKEEQMVKHESELAELRARADYKDKRIDELNKSMHDIDKKLDKITKNIEQLRLESSKDDFSIDARVTAIESKIETLKWVVSAIAVLFSLLTFYMTYLH